MTRGLLRVFLGAAPGVGKTVAMLEEGRRLRDEGVDVVVALVETHGRRATAALVDELELIPRRRVEHRGVALDELDVDAVIARAPAVALVDELAHTNAPGSAEEKRWEDVDRLRDAGIDVLTTVNIQHIASLNDVVERITGVAQRETIPDDVLRAADRIELVDIAPQALRERLGAGLVYPAERIDAALGNYFRLGNLTALRELALLWLADEVEDALRRYRREQGIDAMWESRERVVVALTGGDEGETLIRRAARITARSGAGELTAVHVGDSDGLAARPSPALAAQRALVESLGGSFHELVSTDVPTALIEFARSVDATQLVIGVSRRSRWAALLGGPSVSQAIIRLSGDIDVHIVSHGAAPTLRLPVVRRALSRRRLALAFLVLGVGLPALTALLAPFRSPESIVTDVLAFQLLVVVVTVIGGIVPALAGALSAGLVLNYFFIEPLYGLSIASPRDIAAIGIFVVVAVLVSIIVDQAARRAAAARRSAAESATLVSVAGSVISGADALDTLVHRLREAFGLTSVILSQRGDVTHSARDASLADDRDVETRIPLGEGSTLYLRGPALTSSDRTILGAFVSQLALALLQRRLAGEADAARPIAEADRLRSALLAAVGHDLRRPLAAATASVTALRSGQVALDDADRSELLATAEASLLSLTELVTDLLDVSRLQAGTLGVVLADVAVDSVIVDALDELGAGPDDVRLQLGEGVVMRADAALAQRVVVNLLANALRFSPEGSPPLLSVSTIGDRVQLRVVDHGPGVPAERREEVFAPFQRLTDTDNATGLGLGLALSQGFTAAMGGTIDPEDTPGGGLTMVVELAAASDPTDADGAREDGAEA
ncbi:DUF4118 domain-containing protein [Microcella daejeonensis]|uniref:histidine kinase n=1 Tax=Microcella daejeonensis TaxID=2994971 RepID=A0A9E8MMT1_9MICO|nr:ATP-binding protein [Microcella daejeonensis]WAB82376.1 DUF4118 domain-containing protein [Microcella daejeonensis]